MFEIEHEVRHIADAERKKRQLELKRAIARGHQDGIDAIKEEVRDWEREQGFAKREVSAGCGARLCADRSGVGRRLNRSRSESGSVPLPGSQRPEHVVAALGYQAAERRRQRSICEKRVRSSNGRV